MTEDERLAHELRHAMESGVQGALHVVSCSLPAVASRRPLAETARTATRIAEQLEAIAADLRKAVALFTAETAR